MSKRGNGYGSENRVNILKKVKVGKNWNLYPAVVEPNGKLRDKVRVRGKVEVHPEGFYYIEWWQDGRRREQIKDRAEVVDRARRKAIELHANRAGIETVREIGSGTGYTVAEALASYLKDMEPPQREPKTYTAYKYCLELFASHCAKRFIRDVKREDLLSFIRKLYELGCGPRTAYNRAVIVSQLLKANGITKLLSNRDWPDYVEPIRSIYEPEEIQALLKACDEDERVLYLCYLLTGLRDKEMRYLTWRDVDFRTQVIRVTRKPLYGFKPKNKEEREVPVPASLIGALKKYKGSKKLPEALVFPNESGRPDKRHEFKLKRIAFHAKMNCGQCISKHGNKCSEGPYCSNFFLHKFRHTFATRNLQDHVCDIKTLQNWMGHKDLASTMVYLKAVRNKDVMARVDASKLAALVV
ncbi:MAG: tyrosine-type recombinase/integrase [Candidatus Acidiferrum sp.]